MYDRGFDVISVDWNRNKYVQRFSVIELDLSVAKGEDVLWELISATSPVAMHAGVPGGTSSRNTCRHADNPLGLPNISESTKTPGGHGKSLILFGSPTLHVLQPPQHHFQCGSSCAILVLVGAANLCATVVA